MNITKGVFGELYEERQSTLLAFIALLKRIEYLEEQLHPKEIELPEERLAILYD